MRVAHRGLVKARSAVKTAAARPRQQGGGGTSNSTSTPSSISTTITTSRSTSTAAAAHELALATGLPAAAARRAVVAAGAAAGGGVPCERLQQRVQHLQALLGVDGAATAVQRHPRILASRPEVLAAHVESWLAFFAPEDGASSSDDAAACRQQLLRRLAASPQLLSVDVERLAGNLYEAAAICDAKDLHAYAFKAMPLALMQPQVLQGKMLAVLQLLNAAPSPEGATAPGPRRSSSAAAAAGVFSYQQLQQAARRDHRWLLLSSDTLRQRLLGLQDALQVPMAAVGRMFLLQPSLVNKSTVLLQGRAAALKQLPGLQPETAAAAILAFPALLNLRPEVVAGRWAQLQEAASTSDKWQQQLQALPPTALAALLVRSQARYERLRHVAALAQQHRCSLQTLLRMTDERFTAKFA